MSFGMTWLVVLGIFFAFLAWGIYVDGHASGRDDQKKEKLEKSPMHKIWIGVGIIIAIIFIFGTLGEVFR
jgi:hypothetical protein|tara:strand:+ start:485 stop:694 length:210 start_codon:yes stop_codon:yes gene_type:complete